MINWGKLSLSGVTTGILVVAFIAVLIGSHTANPWILVGIVSSLIVHYAKNALPKDTIAEPKSIQELKRQVDEMRNNISKVALAVGFKSFDKS